jgi:uncharacterized Zn finger protein
MMHVERLGPLPPKKAPRSGVSDHVSAPRQLNFLVGERLRLDATRLEVRTIDGVRRDQATGHGVGKAETTPVIIIVSDMRLCHKSAPLAGKRAA